MLAIGLILALTAGQVEQREQGSRPPGLPNICTNYFVNSKNLTAWSSLNVTVTAAQQDPFGTLNAVKLTDNSTSGFHYINQIPGTIRLSQLFTFTAYAKAGTSQLIGMAYGNGAGCSFNISTGVVTLANNGITCAISPADHGFFHLVMTAADVDGEGLYIIMEPPASTGAFNSYVGTGSTITVAYPQVQPGGAAGRVCR